MFIYMHTYGLHLIRRKEASPNDAIDMSTYIKVQVQRSFRNFVYLT
jgi:hypothetical protein